MISIYSRNLSRTVPRLNCECKGTNFFYSTKLFFIFFENFFITTLITNTIFLKLFFAISLFFPGFLPKFDAFFPFLTYCMSFFTQNACIALHISKINGFLSVFGDKIHSKKRRQSYDFLLYFYFIITIFGALLQQISQSMFPILHIKLQYTTIIPLYGYFEKKNACVWGL